MILRRLSCLLGLLFGLVATAANAQEVPCSDSSLEPALIEARADGLFHAMMQAQHIPGATLAVVKCGKVQLLKGYGFANVRSGAKVDPERTLFRIGSVSKVLTFTALMQLVELGQVEPDEPVNLYLQSIQLPSFEGRDILIRDLFAHRPGFEDRAVGILFKHGGEGMIGMEEWLRTTMPELVRRPSEKTVYSNYGATLAGMVVENVSGEPFHEYVERHILAPLDMRSTSFREPDLPEGFPSLDPQLAARISTGYFYRNGAFEPQPFTYIWRAAPAGSASATSADMARFMLEILAGDTVLSRSSIARIQTRPYADYPSAPGFAWGLRTSWIKGFPTFEHNGAAYTHFSAMVMVPEQQIGIFVSVNGSDDQQAPHKLANALLESMIAGSNSVPGWHDPKALTPGQIALHEGSYLIDRRSYSRLAKLLAPLIGTRKVSGTSAGELNIQGGTENGVYRQVSPGVFHDALSGNVVRFEYDANGRANYLSASYGHFGFDRVGWWGTITPFLVLLAATSILALLDLVWFRPRALAPPAVQNTTRKIRQLATARSVATLALAIALIAAAVQLTTMGEAVAFAWPTSGLIIALAVQWLWLALALAAGFQVLRGAIGGQLSTSALIWPLLVLAIDILLIAQLWQWNFITISI